MSKKYDTRIVMSKAWEIYHRTDMGDGLRPVFSLCLKMAWQHVKSTPAAVIAQWNAIGEHEQLALLKANVRRAAKDEIRFSTENHYNQYNEEVAWFLRSQDLDGFVSDAWLKLHRALDPVSLEKLNAKREREGKCNISLISLVYRSCAYAILNVYRSEIKHIRARAHTVLDKNGDEVEYIDEMATSRRDNTECAAIAAVGLEQFLEQLDDIDRMIIEGKRDGYTQKEIAAMAGISEVAICKRFKKIRAAGVEAGLCVA